MEFVPVIILATMIKKIIDWVRVLMPDRHEAKWLIPASWVVGMAVALLFSLSPALAGDIEIWSGQTLADADVFLVIVYGFGLATVGGVLHDYVKPQELEFKGAVQGSEVSQGPGSSEGFQAEVSGEVEGRPDSV